MLIYLYGPDAYRRQCKEIELVDQYQKKHSALAIERFNLDEKDSLERLKNFATNQSLFDPNKLVLVYNLEADTDLKNFLKSILESKNITLIISAEKKLPKEFDFLLKKPALAQEFEALTASQLETFLKKEADRRQLKIKLEIFKDLAEAFEKDTWGAVMELEKIDLGSKLEKRVAEPEFFPLVQKLKSRLPISVKLPALAYLLENDDPAKVFNIVAALMDPAGKIKMADYDVAVKSGKLEYAEALLDFVLN